MTRSGLTLIEVLLALVLFAVVFVVLAQTQATSLKVTRDSKEATIATEVGNAALETIMHDVLAKSGGAHRIADYYDCGHAVTTVDCAPTGDLGGGYSYSATITGLFQESADPSTDPRSVDEFLREGLVEIAIRVSGPFETSFTSYVSCYDVQDTLTLDQGDPCPDPYDPDAETP